jgi:ABC-type multidrug transport system ATPase subunit
MTALLQVRGLGRDFHGVRAVETVDLDLAEGEVRALIGPNGAGKTTLVGMIAGRIAPSRGRVTFDGRLPRVGTRGARRWRAMWRQRSTGWAWAIAPGRWRMIWPMGINACWKSRWESRSARAF